jgi:hypothetical protein
MRTEWHGIEPQRIEEACQHVAAHDFPETLSALDEMARSAGLKSAHVLDRFGPHPVLRFQAAED